MTSLDKRKLLLRCDKLLKNEALVSVIVVLLGFLIGTILAFIVKGSPKNMYAAIWQYVSGIKIKSNGQTVFIIRNIGETLAAMVPLVLTGLSVAFAYKAGLFNIGAEGQYITGATMATVCAFYGPRVPVIHPLYCLIFAVGISAVFGGLVGYLKAKYEVSEVVATIMFNYIAFQLQRLIIQNLPNNLSTDKTSRTNPFPTSVSIELPIFKHIFRVNGVDALDFGFIIMILVVVAYWFVTEKTTLGYELRATGFNKNAALASGIPVQRSIILSMAIAGGLAGLAGALVAIGTSLTGEIPKNMANYGFSGIAVALIGNCQAVGVLLSGYLFAILKKAQQAADGDSRAIFNMIQGIIVVFVALRAVALILRNRISKKLAEEEGSK